MTQDEIIRFAIQCHLVTTGNRDGLYMDSLIEFANLVADKATEEANARANASWTLMCKKMVAIEREACANLCDARAIEYDGFTEEQNASEKLAQAIRARGEQALAQLKQDGDCKKCKDGCPACDARKLQKEAHDLL